MSDANEAVKSVKNRDLDVPSIETMMDSSSLEKQIAVARAKRQKIIAKKLQNAANSPPKPRDPQMPLAAFVQPDAQNVVPPEPNQVDPSSAKTPNETAVAAPVAIEPKRKVGGLVLTMLACCAALGFGISLGAGIMIWTGMVTIPQVADKTKGDVETTVLTPVATTTAATPNAPDTILTPVTPVAENANIGFMDNPPALEPAVTKNAVDLLLDLPKLGQGLDGRARTSSDVMLVSYPGSRPPELQLLVPAIGSQTSLPNTAFGHDGHSWELVSVAQRVTLGPAVTTTEQALVKPNIQTSVPGPTVQVAYPAPNLAELSAFSKQNTKPWEQVTVAQRAAVGPTIITGQALPVVPNILSVASAPVEVLFAVPSINDAPIALGVPTVPELTTAAIASPTIVTLSAPSADTWGGIVTRPAEPVTLAAMLGYVGDKGDRLNLRLHAPDKLAQDALDAQTQQLEATGFELASTTRVGFNISKNHIRFYNESDREVAQAIASNLGYDLRDFTSTSAPNGLVEIWLEGRTAVRATPAPERRRATTPRAQSQPRRVDPVERLRNNLANQLRNGDHL